MMKSFVPFVCVCLMIGSVAHAQQKPPAVQVDQLLNKLYPGNAGEIERRLATSSTLTATPSPKAAATPAPLVFRLRRTQPGDHSTTQTARRVPKADDRQTTRSLAVPAVPLRFNQKTTGTTAEQAKIPEIQLPNAKAPAKPGGEMTEYLSSLAPADQIEPSRAGAAAGKTPAPVPIEIISSKRVNVNRANPADLVRVLGIDARRARLIVEFRTQQGRIRSPEDLGQVNGITDDMIDKWEKQGLLRFE